MLEIYIADISPLEQEELFDKLMEQVSSHRTGKVLACKNKKDRCRALAAGFLLKKALQKYQIEEQELSYEVNAHGKLMLPEELGLFFNLSHAGDYAVCALSTENVGIDLEQTKERFSGERAKLRLASLKKKTLTEEEKLLFEGISFNEQISLFGRIWTKKESYAKEDGRGMLLPFAEIDTLHKAYSIDQEIAPGYCLSVYQKHPKEAEVIYYDLAEAVKR